MVDGLGVWEGSLQPQKRPGLEQDALVVVVIGVVDVTENVVVEVRVVVMLSKINV